MKMKALKTLVTAGFLLGSAAVLQAAGPTVLHIEDEALGAARKMMIWTCKSLNLSVLNGYIAG